MTYYYSIILRAFIANVIRKDAIYAYAQHYMYTTEILFSLNAEMISLDEQYTNHSTYFIWKCIKLSCIYLLIPSNVNLFVIIRVLTIESFSLIVIFFFKYVKVLNTFIYFCTWNSILKSFHLWRDYDWTFEEIWQRGNNVRNSLHYKVVRFIFNFLTFSRREDVRLES